MTIMIQQASFCGNCLEVLQVVMWLAVTGRQLIGQRSWRAPSATNPPRMIASACCPFLF